MRTIILLVGPQLFFYATGICNFFVSMTLYVSLGGGVGPIDSFFRKREAAADIINRHAKNGISPSILSARRVRSCGPGVRGDVVDAP
jgi:hypothetical protein